MKTSRILFTFAVLALLAFPKTYAQNSEEEQVIRSSNNYVQYTSVIRNFDSKYNVLMQYGYFSNVGYDDTIKGSSSFLIQSTNTSVITHIVTLPKGYQVNDVRFVTLRKIDGVTTEDFCVFCGTRTQSDGIIYLPTHDENDPPQYYTAYSKHGFAGFFSMNEALNPSSSFTAKVRDVEETKELYKMVCYAERFGYYYQNQNAFIDNAVLDIIGSDDTVNAPSCFCRAKFYPDYNGGVHWDNNLRFNSNEVLSDITKTNNFVVTASNNTTGNAQWIRYSELEDHHVLGGLELNDNVNAIDLTSLVIYYNCNPSAINQFNGHPAKICNLSGNNIEMSYYMDKQNFEGLVNAQYSYSNDTLVFLRGAYLKSINIVKELICMPLTNTTAVLHNENNRNNLSAISLLTWNQDANCHMPLHRFVNSDFNLHSLTFQNRNGIEYLLWSGLDKYDFYSPMYLMSQRIYPEDEYNKTCHNTNGDEAPYITIEHSETTNRLHIVYRFPYDDVTYPVTYVNFNPHSVSKNFTCKKY